MTAALAIGAVVVGQAPAPAAAPVTRLTAVLINNSPFSLDLRDHSNPSCPGIVENQVDDYWAPAPPPTGQPIRPGGVATWAAEAAADSADGAGMYVMFCAGSTDAALENAILVWGELGTRGGPVTFECEQMEMPLPCEEATDQATGRGWARFGPLWESALALKSSSERPVVLGQTTFTATMHPLDPLIPAGKVTFTLAAPSARVLCADVPVVSGTATCTTRFYRPGVHEVSASYSGDMRYAAKRVTSAVDVVANNPAVPAQVPFVPTSGGGNGWLAGGAPSLLDYGVLPAGAPKQLAVSSDGAHQLLIDGDDTLYYRKSDERFRPALNFMPLPGVAPGPMKAQRVAVDVDPGNGQTHVLAIGMDGRPYHQIRDPAGSWSGWGLVGPAYFQAADVSIAVDGGHVASIVAVGLDGKVNYRIRRPDGTWTAYEHLPGPDGTGALRASRVALAVVPSGPLTSYLALHTVSVERRVYSSYRDLTGVFGPPSRQTLPAGVGATEIAAGVGSNYPGVKDLSLVAVTGTDGNLYRWIATNGQWTPPAAVMVGPGQSNPTVMRTPGNNGSLGLSIVTLQ